jgi:hypothetical protein
MSKALGWTPDSIEDISAGADPIEWDEARPTFADLARGVLRSEIVERLDALSYRALAGAAIAVTWLQAGEMWGPAADEYLDQTIEPNWLTLTPSLDELLRNPPDLGTMEGLIYQQWWSARQTWDQTVRAAVRRGVRMNHTTRRDGEDLTYLSTQEWPADSYSPTQAGAAPDGFVFAPTDAEDHTLAAASGEDPTSIPDTPTVNRPSPEPEPDEHA